jgi:hypothetical protein
MKKNSVAAVANGWSVYFAEKRGKLNTSYTSRIQLFGHIFFHGFRWLNFRFEVLHIFGQKCGISRWGRWQSYIGETGHAKENLWERFCSLHEKTSVNCVPHNVACSSISPYMLLFLLLGPIPFRALGFPRVRRHLAADLAALDAKGCTYVWLCCT